jgi:hypothetical protein
MSTATTTSAVTVMSVMTVDEHHDRVGHDDRDVHHDR